MKPPRLAADRRRRSGRSRGRHNRCRSAAAPTVHTSWALTRGLDCQGAFALFVEGRDVTAAQALERGLVQELVTPGELQCAVERVTGLPPHALAMVKPLLRASADAGWATALALEEFAEPNCFTTALFQATVRARLEASAS